MRDGLLTAYNRPTPRYTSYPTAPHFKAGFPSSGMAEQLAAVTAEAPVSLYVHIPFCRTLCHYCGCFTKAINDGTEPLRDYMESLRREVRLVQSAMTVRPPVSYLHFGGGSPNMVSPAEIGALIVLLKEVFAFGPDTEIAMEMDPRLLTPERAAGYLAAGVTRVSFGVQDLNPDVQEAINRVQPAEQVAAAVAALRAAGDVRINFDLMYGLPLQTEEKVAQTVRQVMALRPDRLAVFGYAHVPWARPNQKLLDGYPMPDAGERLRMCERATAELLAGGYREVGIDHFAKPDDPLYLAQQNGTMRRNFQGYTTDAAETVIGFGLSAISSFPRAYVQNTTQPIDYRERLAAGEFPVTRGLILSEDDALRRAVIEQLMCAFAVDIEAVARSFGFEAGHLADALPRLERFAEDGLIFLDWPRLSIVEAGRPLARVVCAAFDAYYSGEEQRHAMAV